MNANDHVIRHVGPPAASALRRAGALACFLVALQGFATPSFALTLAQKPLYAGGAIPPLVMLVISKDQQLYKKAYNDYSDLDGDGARSFLWPAPLERWR